MKENKFSDFQPLVYAVIMIMGIVLGFRLSNSGINTNLMGSNSNSLAPVKDVINFIESNYVDSIDNTAFVDEAITNLLEKLDPHSTYISPTEMKEVEESMKGNFDGIGVEFFIVNDTVLVVTPISGGPSERVGIIAGDKIVSIENESIASIGITNKDVIQKLRGKKGTKVNISVKRNGINDLLDFTIVRAKIPIFSVDAGYMMDEETGYIKINRFAATTYKEFADNLVKLKEAGLKNLILDLRQNPGGYLTSCVNIIDEFLPSKKLIMYTQGRNYERKDYKAKRKGLFEDGDVVVLIDEGSASASEILAGALQDSDRATIVGRRSFGKGLVQEQYSLKNGGALRLTVARYYTPTGRSIQKSYELGEIEDYDNELEKRLDSGELSDKSKIENNEDLKFTTPKGRIVYGGGGVVPDVFVPLDTTSSSTFIVKAYSNLSKFSYEYFDKHKSRLKSFKDINDFDENFVVNRDIINVFRKFLTNEKVKVDSRELYRKEELFATRIKANIAKQLFGNDAFFKIINQNDEEVDKAKELINKNLLVGKQFDLIKN